MTEYFKMRTWLILSIAIILFVVALYVAVLYFVRITERGKDIIPNLHQVNSRIYRGGRPGQEGIAKLKQMGIKTIVNLEAELFEQEPGEVKKERDWAEKADIRLEHIPMHPIGVPKKQEVEKALVVLTDPVNHPIFIHCDRGSDRTGIVIAAYRIWFEGWTLEQGYEEMKKYGHRSILLFWWKNLLYKIKEV